MMSERSFQTFVLCMAWQVHASTHTPGSIPCSSSNDSSMSKQFYEWSSSCGVLSMAGIVTSHSTKKNSSMRWMHEREMWKAVIMICHARYLD